MVCDLFFSLSLSHTRTHTHTDVNPSDMDLYNSKITGTGVSKSLPLPCCHFLLCHGWINNPCCGRTRTWEDHLWLYQSFPLFEMIMNASLPKQLLEIPICLLPGWIINQEVPADASASTVTHQNCTLSKVPLSMRAFQYRGTCGSCGRPLNQGCFGEIFQWQVTK